MNDVRATNDRSGRISHGDAEELSETAELTSERGSAADPIQLAAEHIKPLRIASCESPGIRKAVNGRTASSAGSPGRLSRINRDYLALSRMYREEMSCEFPEEGREAVISVLGRFFTVFDMMRLGWKVDSNSREEGLREVAEACGGSSLDGIYRSNAETVLNAIVSLHEKREGVRIDTMARDSIVNHALRIHYLKYMEEGQSRTPGQVHLKRALNVVSGLAIGLGGAGVISMIINAPGTTHISLSGVNPKLFLPALCVGIALSCAKLLYLAFRVRPADSRMQMKAAQILGGLHLPDGDRRKLRETLVSYYNGQDLSGEARDECLSSACQLCLDERDTKEIFEVLATLYDGTESDERRLALLHRILPLSELVINLPERNSLRRDFAGFLRENLEVVSKMPVLTDAGGRIVGILEAFGNFQPVIEQRIAPSMIAGSRGNWEEFDFLMQNARKYASSGLLDGLLEICESAHPKGQYRVCRVSSSDQAIPTGERKRLALYKATFSAFEGLDGRSQLHYRTRVAGLFNALLGDEEESVQLYGIEALRRLKDRSSTVRLQVLSASRHGISPRVRSAAEQALSA